MQMSGREESERQIRELCVQGDIRQATERLLRLYGPEILKVLRSRLRGTDQADEAFGIFSESVLLDLPGFRWESSVRTWAYRIAKNVIHHMRRASGREELVTGSRFQSLAQRDSTRTHPWLRTDVKDRFRALRARLTAEEQRILELRLDRKLPWQQVARATAAPGTTLLPEELKRRSVVLRQQYQRIKLQLRLLGREAALLTDRDSAA